MERQFVTSSDIKSVGYLGGTLEVEFLSGGVYQYYNVPYSHYENMICYAHPGTYFARNVKPYYRYKRVA